MLKKTECVCYMTPQIDARNGRKPGETLNNIRSAMFGRKLSSKSKIMLKLCTLPPTDESFTLHVQRAHFQTAVWKAANLPNPPDLDPVLYGWQVNGNKLDPVKMMEIAPKEVMNFVSCGCKTGCATLACTCKNMIFHAVFFANAKGSCSVRIRLPL